MKALTDIQLVHLKRDWIDNPSFKEDTINLYNLNLREYHELLDELLHSFNDDRIQERAIITNEEMKLGVLSPHQRIGITIGDLKNMANPMKFLQENY